MSSKTTIPEPEENINFIDVHCHIPFPRPKSDKLPSDLIQYYDYLKLGGLYLITCSIDMKILPLLFFFFCII